MSLLSRTTRFLRTKPRLGRLALRMIPDVRWTISVVPVGRFQIRLRRHRSYWLRPPLVHEGATLAAFQRFVRPGDVVYDVGSNIGLYVRLLCSHFKAGKVVGFEPMTQNRELLLENVRLGDLGDRALVLPYALGETDHDEELQIDDMMSASAALDSVTHGAASSGRQQYGLGPKTEHVAVRQLDRLIADQKLPPPQVMKIDIEGAEGMMLRGARQTLETHRPRVIVECHGVEPAREVFATLDGAGYTCASNLTHEGRTEHTILRPHHLEQLKGMYDLHYLIASKDPNDVRAPLPPVDAATIGAATS